MSLNESYAPPGLTDADIWFEITTMVGPIIGAIAYGSLVVLYIMCLDIFFTRGADKSRLWFNLSYTTALFIIGTIGNAANLNVMQISFINNRGFPGGPAAFQVVYYTVPIQIVCMVFFSVGTWMQDAYLLYRFLLFWNFNLWLAIFPALIFMGVVATGTGFMYYALHPGSSILNPLAIKFGTSFFSLSVALNLILTLMIIGRLLYLRQSIRKALGRKHAERYTSIIAMLIESSSLYTTLGLIYIILYALGDPAQNFFLPALGVAECIAPTMIIYRVARGQAFSRDTMEQTRSAGAMGFKAPKPPVPPARPSHVVTKRISSSASLGFDEDEKSNHEVPTQTGSSVDTKITRSSSQSSHLGIHHQA